MSSIPSFNYLGRCYDITTADPLDLAGCAKYENALKLSGANTKSVNTNDGPYDIPDWAEHKNLYGLDYHAETGVVSSTYEFERELKKTVQGTAGTPYGVEFSLSDSVTTFNSQMNSHESSYVYARALRTTHGLQVNVADPSGNLELSAKFVTNVSALPVDSLDKVYPHYQTFFKEFGTHFATEVSLGGQAYQSIKGSTGKYRSSTKTEADFKEHAGVEVEGFKLGLDKTEARKAADTVDQKNELTRTQLRYRGGTGSVSGINDEWTRSLSQQPEPVECNLERLSALLTSKFFSKLSDIDDRRMLMQMAIATWAMEKGKSFVGAKPICYGDTVGLGHPLQDGTFKFMGVNANTTVQTMLSLSSTYQPEQLVVEGKDKGEPVLFGDAVRFRLKDKLPPVYLSMDTAPGGPPPPEGRRSLKPPPSQ